MISISPEFIPRNYQESIFNSIKLNNSLVVLPTGLGKTAIGLMLAVHRLNMFPDSKIVFLAPTKPLVDQHLSTFKELLNFEDDNSLVLFTGSVNPEKRKKLWESAKIIFSTPQGFENDIISNKINFKDVSLLIFDEAHRATGDYSYVYLALEYIKQANNQRILALTASPGSNRESITEILNNLFIDKIEIKKKSDEDVKEYVQETNIEWLNVELPEDLKKIRNSIYDCFKSKIDAIKNFGFIRNSINNFSKTDVLKLQSKLFEMSKSEKSFELLKSISLISEAAKIQYALELIETQSVYSFLEYLKKLEEESVSSKTKAAKNLVKDPNFKIAKILAQKLIQQSIEHPKLNKLKSLINLYTAANKESKVIIFTQYRDTATIIHNNLESINIKSQFFFGQSKKKGIGHSQKDQKIIIQDFKDNEFSVLIATSVAEEGLDIPSVDLVIFYETIPSGIRTIQRRGRTGRHKKGRIIIFVTKNTRDEAFRWVSHHKEKNMYFVLEDIKKSHSLNIKKQINLLKIPKKTYENLIIYCDYREKGNAVLKLLSEKNINIKLETLDIGDFLLSDRLIIEFKTAEDFVNSIIDKRIFEQAKKLRNYERPIIIIQNYSEIFSIRNIHQNAILGTISSLLINYNIPIIGTNSPLETSELLIQLAKREQQETSNNFTLHSSKPLNLKQQQEFIIAGLPGIGNTLNKPLLEKFGSIKNVVNASSEDLLQVDLIGKIKANRLFDLFNTKY